MGHVLELTDENFEIEVERSRGFALVDFWAPWCGPCRVIAPVIDEIARDYAGRIKVAKLNIDENPEVPGGYRIRTVPTVVLFKDGAPVGGVIGAVPRGHLERILEEHI